MNCPVCGSILNERKSNTGVLFLVCSRWPKCRITGTPELLRRIDELQQVPMERPEPVPLGVFVRQVAQMRIHQSKLNAAKTAAERDAVRKQALESLNRSSQ